MRVCRGACIVGASVREYRELEAGSHAPTYKT